MRRIASFVVAVSLVLLFNCSNGSGGGGHATGGAGAAKATGGDGPSSGGSSGTGTSGAPGGGSPSSGGSSNSGGAPPITGGTASGGAGSGNAGTSGAAGRGGSSGQAGASGGGAGSASGGKSGVDCNCQKGAQWPVCDTQGRNWDAACGLECVPVPIACMAPCPCPTACVQENGSCAQNEKCCSGLTCCAGVPVPQGQEYCGKVCPKSDMNMKRGFTSVEPSGVLDKLAALPISKWSYRTEDSEVTHLGPMAQEFKAAFELGDSDKTILQVDADGVAFAAIQALYQRLQDLETRNRALERRLNAVEAECSSR